VFACVRFRWARGPTTNSFGTEECAPTQDLLQSAARRERDHARDLDLLGSTRIGRGRKRQNETCGRTHMSWAPPSRVHDRLVTCCGMSGEDMPHPSKIGQNWARTVPVLYLHPTGSADFAIREPLEGFDFFFESNGWRVPFIPTGRISSEGSSGRCRSRSGTHNKVLKTLVSRFDTNHVAWRPRLATLLMSPRSRQCGHVAGRARRRSSCPRINAQLASRRAVSISGMSCSSC
jgi:hypothetical protein